MSTPRLPRDTLAAGSRTGVWISRRRREPSGAGNRAVVLHTHELNQDSILKGVALIAENGFGCVFPSGIFLGGQRGGRPRSTSLRSGESFLVRSWYRTLAVSGVLITRADLLLRSRIRWKSCGHACPFNGSHLRSRLPKGQGVPTKLHTASINRRTVRASQSS
jgi:hypothetical protein